MDKGRENINSEIRLLTTTLNLKHIVSSIHHPQSNGLVERRQQMISNFMQKMRDDIASQRNWHLKIPNLQTIINSSVSSTRGFSPIFLTFFRHANFPFQNLHAQKPNYNENSTVVARFNLAQEALQQSQEALGLSFNAAKVPFDKKPEQSTFQPGDTVFVETSQRNLLHRKFADRYKGPFKVVDLLPNNNLKLVPLDNGSPISTHFNNCKLGLTRPVRLERTYTSPSESQNHETYADPFRFSTQATHLPLLFEDEDDDLLPAPDNNPHVPPAQPAQLRTPARPAPAPPSPANFPRS